MADMGNPDGVRDVADAWHRTGGAFHDHAARIASCQMRPEHFGSHYAEQMGGIRDGIGDLAERMRHAGQRYEQFGGKLHGAVDAYQGTDEGNAESLRLNL